MFKITCPVCGFHAVESIEGKTAVCARCKNPYPIPRGYSLLESSFEYAADDRRRRDFSAALASYSEIIKQHPNSAAAYWFRAISRYQVEYQQLSETEYRLVCHQATLRDFAADVDVQNAISLATGGEKDYYIAQCTRISQLQKQVSAHAAVTAPYDVILVADAANQRALDCARKIRTGITAAGMRCFCPALDLQNLPRQNWEPALYHGMTTAGTMVYVAVGKNSFPADTVFDAQRYLSLKAASQRDAFSSIQQFIVAFANLDEYEDIPDDLFDGADHRLSMAANGFMDRLCQILQASGADYDQALRTESGGHENYVYTNLIRQARLSLESSDFPAAQEAYNQILNYNPRESQAYWGLLLAGFQCCDEEALIKKGILIRENSNYRSAIAFANEREAQTYQQVAENAQKTHQLYKAQQENRERMEREQAQLRAQKDAQLQAEIQKQHAKRIRARITRIIIAICLAIACAIVGLIIYQKKEAEKAIEERYRTAMDFYAGGDFSSARLIFEELGDYKDSAEMIAVCEQEGLLHSFYSAQFLGQDLATREDAVEAMQQLLEEIPEAQDYLDQWLQDATDYYEAGDYGKAFLAAKGFGTRSSVYMNLWRLYQSQGLIAASDEGSILAISNGQLKQFNCEHLGIEDGSYLSVDLSDGGKSAGLVRADGTVLLAGEIAQYYNVSDWTDMQSIQIGYNIPVGLKKDGTLISAASGTLATDVVQFDSFRGQIAAVRSDGSVYCSFDAVNEVVSDWTDATHVGIMFYDGVLPGESTVVLYIVNQDDTLHIVCWDEAEGGITDDGSEVEENGVVCVVTDSMAVAKLYINGSVYSNRTKGKSADYDKAFLITLSDAMDVRIREDMSGYGLNGGDEIQIEMRKFINSLENIGLPQ